MKHTIYSIITLLAILLIASGCSDNQESEENTETKVAPTVRKVKIADVTKESITATITTNGRIKQADDYNLSFPINGTIASTWIAKGNRVTAGQQIATIKEVTVENRISQSQLNTQQTQNNIQRLQSQLKVASDNLIENKALHIERLITGDELNSSRLKVESIQSQLNNAAIQLDIVNREIGILGEQRNLHILVAPAAGIITEKLAQSGEQVAAGQSIGILQPDTRQHIFRCTVSDREVIQLNIGSRASIDLDAYPDQPFNGRITYISQESTNTGTYEIEITIDASEKRLLPGMFGHVTVSNNQVVDYLSIPVNALTWADDNEGKVMIASDLNAEVRSIKVYKIKGDQVLIHDGLSESDKVILNANGLINSGDSIAIIQ